MLRHNNATIASLSTADSIGDAGHHVIALFQANTLELNELDVNASSNILACLCCKWTTVRLCHDLTAPPDAQQYATCQSLTAQGIRQGRCF